MGNEIVRMLTLTSLASTLALAVVLIIRAPLRRYFGARVAYLAWWLVPLAMLAILLPAPVREVAMASRIDFIAMRAAPVQAIPLQTHVATGIDLHFWLLLLWSCGAVAAATWFGRMQRRYLQALGHLSPRGRGVFVSQSTAACPAVVGAWRPRIVLPADFDSRYPAHEGQLVMAHERAHLRRGDAAVNLAVVLLRSVHWFNPLLHWAASRFREDQEMACDALVLAEFPDRRRSYAEAMLKTQLAVLGLPVGCHWQSSQSLKERIVMLKQPLPGRSRLRIGLLSLGVVVFTCSFGAWALQPAQLVQPPAMVGTVVEDAVAVASVTVVGDGKQVEMSGGAMVSGSDGSTEIFLVPQFPFNASVGEGEARWAMETTVSADLPTVVNWKLTRGTQVVGQTRAALHPGAPLQLQLGDDQDGSTRLLVSIRTVPADKVMRTTNAVYPAANEQTRLDTDDAFRYAHGNSSWGKGYAVNGEAMLLLTLDAAGQITDVQIEQVKPAGGLTLEQARMSVKGLRYSPKLENGRAVPSRIRLPLQFGPEYIPQARSEAEATQALTFSGNVVTNLPAADSPVEIESAPAPAYPAAAHGNKRNGKVVLNVDVGADGSVVRARVDQSYPPSEFDAAALQAVAKWKFTPAKEKGRAVPGKVQIPVVFENDGDRQEAAPSAQRQVWFRGAGKPPVREAHCDTLRVDQDQKTGDISAMECGITAAAKQG